MTPTGGPRVAGLVLAAGASRRMGRPKQLLPVDGRPMVLIAADTLHAAGLAPVVVVLGAAAEEIRAAVAFPPGTRVVVNPDHASGQASSLQAGLRAMDADIDAAVAMVCDRPGVTADAVKAVLAAAAASPEAPAAQARYDDGAGHPVLLRRALWPRLMELRGDVGARVVLHQVPVAEGRVPGPAPPDADTPDDYRRLIAPGSV